MAATESGRVQVVYTANVGSPLAADVAAGATVITVDDTSDFDSDGTLQVAGQTVAYSAVDDDTGQVTLTGAVTGAAEAGDIVTLWDTGLDQAAVEYRAHVALPGVLDNADAVDATIRHTLIGYLEEGIRNPGAGESVRMERHGLDWVIVDLLGKRPAFSGGGGGGGGGGGPVAAARFEDPEDFTLSYGSGGIRPSYLNPGTVVGDPSCWVYDGAFGVRFAVDGWYQASADGHVWGLNGGDTLSITVRLYVTNWFGEVSAPAVAAETGTPGNSNVWLSATSLVFWARANDSVEMAISTVSLTSSSSDTVIERCGINLVRFDAGGGTGGGGTGGGGAATGTASMTLAAIPTAAAATATAGMTLAATGTVATAPVAATGTASMTLAATAAVTTVTYDAAVLADSALVYWKMDETSGTTMTDSSGNARDGTYSGATLNQAPLVNDGGRSALGGNSGQGVGSIASAAWMEQASFTVECWVKPNNTVTGGKSFYSRFNGGNMHWAIYQDIGRLRFTLGSSGAEATGPTYTVGAIYHLVGTYDGANLRLYVNGSLFATTATVQSGANGQAMQVGGHAGGSYSQATVDNVAFYAGALSATRVAAHYAAGI